MAAVVIGHAPAFELFNLLFSNVLRIAAFHTPVLPIGDGLYSIFLPSHVSLEDIHSG